MKLFLTSAGIRNKSLAKTIKELMPGKLRFGFIPTAANVEPGHKDWLIEDINNLQALGTVDIIDISALPKTIWLDRIKKCNVIVVSGGNTYHLLLWMKKSGFAKELPQLLKSRIYVGISAGSIVLSKDLGATQSKQLYNETPFRPSDVQGLGYVDFYVRPHYNSPDFPKIRDPFLKKLSRDLDGEAYAIDDQTGIVVHNNKITIITEGKWKLF